MLLFSQFCPLLSTLVTCSWPVVLALILSNCQLFLKIYVSDLCLINGTEKTEITTNAPEGCSLKNRVITTISCVIGECEWGSWVPLE